MRAGSVCSGIGAPECAWRDLGWSQSFVSEIEPFPRAVLAHRFPGAPLHGDFTTIKAGDYEPIDLLVGGTPCQSFSVAGLRGGMADQRGNLALEYLRLADRLRPRWLVWENVPGVLSSAAGRDFGAFLGGVVQLGYGFAYRVLDAQHFGVAQRRRRVFVVGYLGDWRRAAAVLFEPASLRRHPAPRREAGEVVAPTIARGSPGGRRYGEDADTCDSLVSMCLTSHPGRYDAESQTLITGTLCNNGKAAGSATQQDAESGFLIAHTLRGEGHDASEDGTGRGTPLVPCLTSNGDAHSGFRDEPGLVPYTLAIRGRNGSHDLEYRQDGLANTLLTPNGGRGGIGVGAVAFDTQQITSAANRTRVEAGLPLSTLAARSRMHAAQPVDLQNVALGGDVAGTLDTTRPGRGGGQALMQGMAVRRLTPRECERLQGFPDDWTAVAYRGKAAPDGPRYKALGNSMAVPVLRWIGERIAMQEAAA